MNAATKLVVKTNAGDSYSELEAQALDSKGVFIPLTHTFDTVSEGEKSEPFTVRLKNEGNVPLEITEAPKIIGKDKELFEISSNECTVPSPDVNAITGRPRIVRPRPARRSARAAAEARRPGRRRRAHTG